MSAVLKRKAADNALASILDCLPQLSRENLCQLAEWTINRIDDMDPDPDLEGQWDEDGINSMFIGSERGPGCPIADNDHGIEDCPCDPDTEDGI